MFQLSQFFLLITDETIWAAKIAQVVILVCGVNESLDAVEELAAMVPHKGTAKRSDLLETVITNLISSKLNLNKSGVTTSRAQPMCGS